VTLGVPVAPLGWTRAFHDVADKCIAVDTPTGFRAVGAHEDIDDVGVAALWQDFGDGSGLFLAQGEDYFVGVTVAAGGLAVGQPVAEALLDAL